MRIGIVGLTGSGKTTVFDALSGASAPVATYGGPSTKSHLASVAVPDARLTRLGELLTTQKVSSSRAKKIFICNLMTQKGNTDNFSVQDFLIVLGKYLGKNPVDHVIFNTGKLPKALLKKIKKVFPKGDFVKYDKNLLKNKKFIGEDILDHRLQPLNPSDILVKKENRRTMVLHNSNKLAKIIVNLCRQ